MGFDHSFAAIQVRFGLAAQNAAYYLCSCYCCGWFGVHNDFDFKFLRNCYS
jgi:hypothetical protein